MRKKRFTLLELLVTISIISILAGLLLPVIGRARGSAMKTKCKSNLRQLGLGLALYTDDYNDNLPPYAHWEMPDGSLHFWFTEICRYLGGKVMDDEKGTGWIDVWNVANTPPLLICPMEGSLQFGDITNAVCYGWVAYDIGLTDSGWSTDPVHGSKTKLSRVSNPAGTTIIGDSPNHADVLFEQDLYVLYNNHDNWHTKILPCRVPMRHSPGNRVESIRFNGCRLDGSVHDITGAQMLLNTWDPDGSAENCWRPRRKDGSFQ